MPYNYSIMTGEKQNNVHSESSDEVHVEQNILAESQETPVEIATSISHSDKNDSGKIEKIIAVTWGEVVGKFARVIDKAQDASSLYDVIKSATVPSNKVMTLQIVDVMQSIKESCEAALEAASDVLRKQLLLKSHQATCKLLSTILASARK